jgi:pyrroline-5-carboxylate reductase
MPMQQTATTRIAFIGGGKMARALIAGLIRHAIPPHHLSVGEPDAHSRAALQRDFGVTVSADNAAAISGAELVVLAVYPQQAAGVLHELRAALQALRPLLLSIAAGLRIADLTKVCPPGLAIARAMPNRPALVGAGITGLYAASAVPVRQRQLVELVGEASGSAVWLRSEAELDVVTALSGSGPAYFFLLAERMARAAERLGLEPHTALLLAGATLRGAGMLANEGTGLAQQRAAVTSKGGTTEAALRVLDQGGFDELIARAVEAATARSIELAGMLSASLQAEHR